MAARASEVAAAFAVATAAAAVLLGGAFWPAERVGVGIALAGVAATAAAVGWTGFSRSERIAVLLLGWSAAVAVVAGVHDLLAARESLVEWMAVIAVWIVVRRAGRIRRQLMWLLVAVATAVAVAVLVHALALGAPRAGGLFDSPNLAAAVLVPVVPVARRCLAGVGVRLAVPVLLLLGVGATGSRAGVVAAVVATVLTFEPGRTRRIVTAVAGIAAFAVIGWRLVAVPDPLAWHRPAIWGAVGRLVVAHPVAGVGPGNLVDAAGPVRLAHHGRATIHEHAIGGAESTPLALAAAVGIVGLLLAVIVLREWWREARERDGIGEVAPWWVAAAPGMAVVAVLHDLLAASPVLWWWGAVLGLAVGSVPPPPRSRSAAATAAVAVVALWLVLWGLAAPGLARVRWTSGPPTTERMDAALAIEPWLAEPLEWRVDSLLQAQHWSWRDAAEAEALAERLIEIRPGVFSAWLRAGRVAGRTAVEIGPWRETIDLARWRLEKAAALEPHLPWPWLARAHLERAVSGSDSARPFVQRALDEEPLCAPAWLLVARIALQEGRLEVARSALGRIERAADRFRLTGQGRYAREVLTVPPGELEALRRELR